MTYMVIRMTKEWALEALNSKNAGAEYKKALIELAVACKKVMKFL